MQAFFQGGGRKCVRRIALNALKRRDKTLSERCFRVLYGMRFGLGVLPTLRPRMVSWNSGKCVNLGLLAGVKRMFAKLCTSITAFQQANHRSFRLAILLDCIAICGHEKTTGFRMASELSASGGRIDTDVNSWRVSCTHTSRELIQTCAVTGCVVGAYAQRVS
jgi:hypothetical protein